MFFALVPSLCAQKAIAQKHIGFVEDWSQSHIVFSRDALARHPALVDREPRIRQQAIERWQVPDWGAFHGVDPRPIPPKKSGLHRDWNMSLSAARLGPHVFPAKFSFDPNAPPDCTGDYVVFGLDVAETPGASGMGVQANLVGFNNLYSGTDPTGTCGTAPSVMFAYNVTTVTGGRIVTSPVLSLDGTQIAFVESVAGATPQAIFHVLTLALAGVDGTGAITDAVAPATGSMTSLTLSPTGIPPFFNDTTSSPWIDYDSDTAYVGTDNGFVYQISGAFTASPTLTGSPWPVQVGSSKLTSPVLDSNLKLLMVGSANGTLYQIDVNPADSTFGTVVATLPVGNTTVPPTTSSGIFAPPIVDITNGTTFVVSANGTYPVGPDNSSSAILLQVDTETLGTAVPQVAYIGLGSAGGTALHLFEPAFNNAYYNDPSTGYITLCGTGPLDTRPWQYAFGFTGSTMNTLTPPVISQQLSTSTTDHCSGWTEFFNPNVGASPGTDFFFFGLNGDCTSSFLGGTSTTGCVVALGTDGGVTTATTATVKGGPSGIVVDNYSTATQASSIYFVAAGEDTAYKYTQNGLQ